MLKILFVCCEQVMMHNVTCRVSGSFIYNRGNDWVPSG